MTSTHHRSPPSPAVQAELGALGSFGGSLEADLSSSASIDALVKEVSSQQLRLDALVINSGVHCQDGFSKEGVEETVNINTLGVARLTRELLPLLAHNATVLISSSASSRGWMGTDEDLLNLKSSLVDAFPSEFIRCQMLYGRSKALINAFVMRMAKEHPNIRFLSAFPNPTHTDMLVSGIGKATEILRYPPFFRAGTQAFDSFLLFWVRALTRPVEKVARQYVYGLTSNLPSGSFFFKETPYRPMPYEEAAAFKITF